MAPLQQPLGRGADLLGLLQLAGRLRSCSFSNACRVRSIDFTRMASS